MPNKPSPRQSGDRRLDKRPAPANPTTRTMMLASNPPIKVVQRKVNGRWVEVSRQRMPRTGGMQKLPRKVTRATAGKTEDQRRISTQGSKGLSKALKRKKYGRAPGWK